MKIIKRNGSEATFDSEKIVAAITKANNSEEGTRLSPEQIHDIADYVEYKCNKIGRAWQPALSTSQSTMSSTAISAL